MSIDFTVSGLSSPHDIIFRAIRRRHRETGDFFQFHHVLNTRSLCLNHVTVHIDIVTSGAGIISRAVLKGLRPRLKKSCPSEKIGIPEKEEKLSTLSLILYCQKSFAENFLGAHSLSPWLIAVLNYNVQ